MFLEKEKEVKMKAGKTNQILEDKIGQNTMDVSYLFLSAPTGLPNTVSIRFMVTLFSALRILFPALAKIEKRKISYHRNSFKIDNFQQSFTNFINRIKHEGSFQLLIIQKANLELFIDNGLDDCVRKSDRVYYLVFDGEFEMTDFFHDEGNKSVLELENYGNTIVPSRVA